MSASTASPAEPGFDVPGMRRAVDEVLEEFLMGKVRSTAESCLPEEVPRLLYDFCFAGGKRLRPLLCVVGWHAAGGSGDIGPVVRVAASLEMFHAFALIHDDVMDDSAIRRGRLTVHRALAVGLATGRSRSQIGRLAAGGAILIGDLALAWSDEIVHTAGLTPAQLSGALPLIDAMREEVMCGQYLDVTTTGRPTADVEGALAITRYKTAKYTCERPLHIGAALAGADQQLLDELSAFALPTGEAFQLRDDLLGVFGDPAVTGKPCSDDLRDGKYTTLVALALRDSAPRHQGLLRGLLGREDLTAAEAAQIRTVLVASGARAQVEDMIARRSREALSLLDSVAAIAPAAVPHLRRLVPHAAGRTS
ncbi:polyprenyl synthetase family protein [Streptomyces formicae]|uniref:Polyprenyl synthetase family protein n=1 Tax=Streptomyces formicae TaxID=1616117 RepID=A0ABY3WK64_9ACTN|nr:polyprenyl synthetase family protein [Streptomyces formicae]UNM13003.1 polyprenyl synthetase family protein [Streptomyces formicae]